MDYGSARHRYQHDPQFKHLVDLMWAQIMEMNYTPSEMRDAAMLASLKFEETRVAEFVMSATEFRKMALK